MKSTGTIHALVVAALMTLASVGGAAELAQSFQRESSLDRQAAARDAAAQIETIKATAVEILSSTAALDAPYLVEATEPLALSLDILQRLRTSDISDLLVKHARTFVTGIAPGRKAADMLIANGGASIPACLNGIRITTDEAKIALLCHILVKILESEDAAKDVLKKEAAASSDKSASKKFRQTATRLSEYVTTVIDESKLELIKDLKNPWDEAAK